MPHIMIMHEESCLKIDIRYPTSTSCGFLSFEFADKVDDSYDLENSIRVDLGMFLMAHVQMVFRGQVESVNEGKPIKVGDVNLLMKHVVEPTEGYAIGVKEGERRCQIFLDKAEALAVSEAISTAFFFVAFVRGVS